MLKETRLIDSFNFYYCRSQFVIVQCFTGLIDSFNFYYCRSNEGCHAFRKRSN